MLPLWAFILLLDTVWTKISCHPAGYRILTVEPQIPHPDIWSCLSPSHLLDHCTSPSLVPQQAHFCLWTISAFPPEASAPPPHHVHTPWPHVAPLSSSHPSSAQRVPFLIASFPPDLSFSWHLPSLEILLDLLCTQNNATVSVLFQNYPWGSVDEGRDQEDATLVMRQGAPPPPQWKFLGEKQLCLAPLLDDSWSYNMNRQKQGRGLFWGWQPRLSAVFLWCKSPEIRTDPGS